MTHQLRALFGTSAMALALAGTPALAQDEDPQGASDDRNVIIVTAQFREQNLQDTPIAITAINGEMLEARGQTNIADVASQAPNVTLASQSQEFGSGIIAYIRGIGQNDPNFALEPGVGIYIDDVYLPTLTGSLLDLMDVDRVEVLRGPQGTLAGRNSIGGAIKMYSVKPQGDNTGSVSVTYGSYDRIDLRGVIDLGLADNLAVRIAGVSKNEDGYVKRLDYALTHPGSNVPSLATGDNPVLGTLGGKSIAAGKISLRWEPTPTVEVNLSADYTRERNEPGAAALTYANAVGLNNNDPTRPWLRGTDGNPVNYNCQFVPFGPNGCDTITGFNRKYITYSTFNDLAVADSQLPFRPLILDPHSDLDNYGVALTIDVELSDNLALKSITSWREYEADWSYDLDGAPLASVLLNQNQTNEQISQELRLTGTLANDLIDFTVGGFYFDTDGFYTARVDLPYAGLDFLHGPDPTPSENKALFANVTVNLTDAFHITGGIRQSWDKKEYEYARRNPDLSPIEGPCNFFLGAPVAGPVGIGNQPNCLLFGINGTTATFKNSQTDWRIAADYRFSPELLVYTQVSTGYRAGGFNPRPFFPSQAVAHVPETITSYEVGFKADLLDRRVRLNAAAFYFDYDNIVLLSTFCSDLLPLGQAAPCLRPTNVGSAKVKGLEVEAYVEPVENFTIDGSISYLDFQYKQIDPTAGTGVAIDDITPYTPEFQYSFGLQYVVPEVLGGNLSVRFDGAYQSKIYTEAGNVDALVVSSTVPEATPFSNAGGGGPLPTVTATNRINGYFVANGRINWKSEDAGWGLALEVQNIFDKYYFTSLVNDSLSSANVFASPGKPRTWALTVTKEF